MTFDQHQQFLYQNELESEKNARFSEHFEEVELGEVKQKKYNSVPNPNFNPDKPEKEGNISMIWEEIK